MGKFLIFNLCFLSSAVLIMSQNPPPPGSWDAAAADCAKSDPTCQFSCIYKKLNMLKPDKTLSDVMTIGGLAGYFPKDADKITDIVKGCIAQAPDPNDACPYAKFVGTCVDTNMRKAGLNISSPVPNS